MNEKIPEVAVLLSTYGVCPYREELRHSLRNQTIPFRLIERSDDPPEHLGINGSFRNLMTCVPASCDYVAFCDQDDVWLPAKLKTLLAAMQREDVQGTVPLLVHSDAFVTDSGLTVTKKSFIRKWARFNDFFGALMFNKVQGASMMINRPLLDAVKDMPEQGLMYDRFIHLVAEISGKRVFVDKPLMYYRQHGSNAVGAESGSKKPHMRFLNDDDRKMLGENAMFFLDRKNLLDPDRQMILDDYFRFTRTANPVLRVRMILKYLRPYPSAFTKKLIRAALP